MTTSLSNPSTNEIFPGATTPATSAATLSDGLAALLPPAGSATAAGANVPLPTEFSSLLDGGAPLASTEAASVPAANRPAAAINPTAPETSATVRANTPQSTLAQTVASAGSAVSMPTDARGFALKPARSSADVLAGKGEAAENADGVKTGIALPDRATLEAIVALLAPVALVAEPAPIAGAPIADGEVSMPEAVTLASGEPQTPTENSQAMSAPARGHVTVTLPGQAAVVLDENLSPTVTSNPFAAETHELAAARATAANPQPGSTPTQPGAVTANGRAPIAPVPNASPVASQAAAAAQVTVGVSANRAGESPALPTIEATAAVELSDGAVVTFALPSKSPISTAAPASSEPSVTAAPVGPEKSAALPRAETVSEAPTEKRAGKNFLSAGNQDVRADVTEAGIGVAQTRSTMLFTPHDTLPTVHSTVPALVSTVEVAPQMVGTPAPEPMPQLVAASVAHRAVEAVTSIVDAQAASKLQPVPSVQLKFKIGHEDLAVRVALRDGVVHTEFRTDSPELRAALQQEWKAVTAQPESALRYLEPVVSAASSTQSGTNSFAQQQQQHSSGQSAAQQQQQQQQQARAAAEFFGSVARSTPFQPRDGGAVANVAAAVLPTSVHLSAVA